MELACRITAPVDSIAAIFPKVSLRSNTVHMSATFFSTRPAGMKLVDTWRVTLMAAGCCFSYLQWLF